MDTAIFGLRRHSNVLLYPSQDELDSFLSRPIVVAGRRTTRDPAAYRALIDEVRAAQQRPPAAAKQKILSDVLRHTRFASTALATEVACYQYLLEALKGTDIRKAAAFIRAAEEEIAKLDPRKKDQADRIGRLRSMSAERKRQLEELVRRRHQLASELRGIAEYVRGNLLKIAKICSRSLAILSDFSQAAQIEQRLLEDLKVHFRSGLKRQPDRSQLTPAFLEQMRSDVAKLGDELVAFRRDAATASAALYRSLLLHAESIGREIEGGIKLLAERRDEGDATDQMHLARIEQQLVTLIGWQPEAGLPEPITATPHIELFTERKREVLESLFTLVSGERRGSKNRRSGLDRRLFVPAPPKAAERRTKASRRSGQDRRAAAEFAF